MNEQMVLCYLPTPKYGYFVKSICIHSFPLLPALTFNPISQPKRANKPILCSLPAHTRFLFTTFFSKANEYFRESIGVFSL